jgi:hypothetical protein
VACAVSAPKHPTLRPRAAASHRHRHPATRLRHKRLHHVRRFHSLGPVGHVAPAPTAVAPAVLAVPAAPVHAHVPSSVPPVRPLPAPVPLPLQLPMQLPLPAPAPVLPTSSGQLASAGPRASCGQQHHAVGSGTQLATLVTSYEFPPPPLLARPGTGIAGWLVTRTHDPVLRPD